MSSSSGLFTRVPNEILETLAMNRLPGQEYQIVLLVARRTYGFNKPADDLSYGQISRLTGIPRVKVIPLIRNLILKKILASTNNGTRKPLSIWINDNYREWAPSPKKGTSPNIGTSPSPNMGYEDSPNNGTHKRNIKKEKKNARSKDSNGGSSSAFAEDSLEQNFLVFWQEYPPRGNPPKRSGKEQAWKTWQSLSRKKELPDIAVIISCLDAYKAGSACRDPQYIKLPSTWLNGKPWKDDEPSFRTITGSLLDSINPEDVRAAD